MPSPLSELKPLTPSECPLLTKYGGGEADRLIGRFADALAEVRKLESDRQLAPILLSGRFNDTLKPLVKVRNLMTQQRYSVGCIGITQAGKSTTINNVLGEEVCKPGAGDACSSQPSRIIFAERRSLDIEFLTPDRLAIRRQQLCEQIGLATPEDDTKLLPMLDKPELFRTPDGQEPPRLREDLAYLRDFLNAYRKQRDFVHAPPKQLSGQPYEKRYLYTTHTKGGPSAEVLLVREARFRIDNRLIPPDLELCDLPGLDSKRSIDDIVTWEYLPDLHGTFLFVNVGGNLLTEGMLKILARIHREFRGKLAGRAWVIFNKMDTLTGDHFRPGGQDNIFVTIGRLLEKTGIPESQVCFCAKKIWDVAAAAGGTADPAAAARMMNQSADHPVPATCPPGLQNAWKELLKDGGISNVRRLMFRDVAESLAGEIRQDVDRLLDEFNSGLAARVAAERKRLSMGSSELQAAVTCYNVVLQLRVALGTRPQDFPILIQEGERLRKALTDLFDSGDVGQLLENLSAAELATQFKTHARVLTEILSAELTGEILDKVYQVIGQRLEGLPAVTLGPQQEGCKDVWQRFAIEDRADDDWRVGLPQFASDDLGAWLTRATGDGVDGTTYAGLMRDKIDVAVRRTVHLIRSRLRQRLGQIAGQLSVLTGAPEPNAAP
jgi:hypothetical protein